MKRRATAFAFAVLFIATAVYADIATIKRGVPTVAATVCTPGSFKYGGGKLFFCYTSNAFKKYSSVSF